jgi:hypothetical protein
VRPEGLGKFKNSPHRVSNPHPSGLWHSALTTTLVFFYQLQRLSTVKGTSVSVQVCSLCVTSRCHIYIGSLGTGEVPALV